MHLRGSALIIDTNGGRRGMRSLDGCAADWRIAYGDRSRLIAVNRCGQVDLILCGSVAVNRGGARFGKGAGYPNIEVALLTDAD